MKIADQLAICGDSGKLEFYAAAERSFCLLNPAGEPLVELGRISAGEFSEALALPEKLRAHHNRDRLSAEFENITVIPFGCEYHVRRKYQALSNILLISTDVSPDNGGRINDLELEPIHFNFTPEYVEFMVYGDNELHRANSADGELYCGREPVIMLRAVAGNGCGAEFYAGDDIWRHRAGVTLDCAKCCNTLTWDNSGVTLLRKVLAIPADQPGEKRPWKFKSLLAWQLNSPAPSGKANTSTLNFTGCLAAAPNRRELRKQVRSGKDAELTICGEFPAICLDARHLERPAAEMAHGDLAEAVNAFIWANRELAKRNGCCTMIGSGTVFGNTITQANLAAGISVLQESEDDHEQ